MNRNRSARPRSPSEHLSCCSWIFSDLCRLASGGWQRTSVDVVVTTLHSNTTSDNDECHPPRWRTYRTLPKSSQMGWLPRRAKGTGGYWGTNLNNRMLRRLGFCMIVRMMAFPVTVLGMDVENTRPGAPGKSGSGCGRWAGSPDASPLQGQYSQTHGEHGIARFAGCMLCPQFSISMLWDLVIVRYGESLSR